VMPFWLELKVAMTFSRASPSGPPQRYGKLIVTFSAGAEDVPARDDADATGAEPAEPLGPSVALLEHAATATTAAAMTAVNLATMADRKLRSSSAGVLW
jgi:hypothetical protein